MLSAVLQIDGYDPVSASAVTLRASSIDDERVCQMNGQTWLPALLTLPALRYDLFDGDFSGKISTPQSSLTLAVEDWPDFARYVLADARVQMWAGEPGDDWANWTQRFDGRAIAQATVSDGIATLTIAVDDRWLDKPLLATYAGTTGIEGEAAMKGKAKPLALGAPRYVPGALIDTTNTVIQLSSYGAIQAVEYAMERLARFGSSLGDYASYAALVAATIPAGQWATCKASGLVRHGAPPAGQLSYHVQGDNSGPDGWARTAGKLIRRIALLAGGSGKIDDASLNALDTARPWTISLYQDSQTTARDLIQRIAASVNAVAGVDWLGKLWAVPVGFGSPTVTLDATGAATPPVASVDQLDVAPPFGKLAIGAVPTWSVHALADVAFTALLVDRGRYVATETYREGHVVDLIDGSRWLYINPTPTSGNAPPASGSSNSWWTSLSPTAVQSPSSGNELKDDTFQSGYWNLHPQASRNTRNATAGFGLGYADYMLDWIVPVSVSQETNSFPDKVAVVPGQVYAGEVWCQKNSSVPSGTSFSVGIRWFDSAGATISGPSNNFTAGTDLVAGAAPKKFAISAVAPSNAVSAILTLYIAPIAGASGTIRWERPKLANDLSGSTSVVIASLPDTIIACDYLGNIKSGELPRDVGFQASLGNLQVTAATAWSRDSKTGVTDTMGAATGILNVTAMSGTDVTHTITGIYAGVTRTVQHRVRKELDPPPSGGSGSGAGSSASDSSFASINSTTPAVISDVLEVVAASTTISLNANLGVSTAASAPATSYDVQGKWQELIGATWTDVGSSTSSNPDANVYDTSGGEPGIPSHYIVDQGTLTNTVARTGKTIGTNYKFRFLAWNTSGTRTMTFNGTCAVTS